MARVEGITTDYSSTRDITLYSHIGKDSMWDYAQAYLDVDEPGGLSSKAAETFVYTGYEIELSCTVDMTTGVVTLNEVNGIALTEPVRI